MDPLSVLRDYAVRGELDKVTRSGDEFHFGGSDYSFPCYADTAYRSKHGSLYSLETLLFFLRHHHLKHTDYLQSARVSRVPAVTLPDRKPLLDYLLGRVSSSDAVDPLFHPPPPSSFSIPDDHYLPGADLPLAAEPDPAFITMIRALERPLKDREALLECRNRDFYSVLTASVRRQEERHRIESQQRKDGLVAKSRLLGSDPAADDSKMLHLKGSKLGEGVPIILVPSAFQTLITMHNVKDFLEDGVFVPSDVKVKQCGDKKPECLTVYKKFSRDRTAVAYEVRDKPSALKPDQWDRVVAVFVLGKEWQFKDWPFKDHVEIFNKIIGFYVRFEDDSIESAKVVKQWNVKIISISKNKRHQDKAAALEVWNRLEEFMRARSHS